MNLMDLVVKITCDDQASGEVAGIGSKITSALGTAAKVGGAAVAALGTATIALGKTALDAYANYEQLVGGIDTLFKNSSGKMQQYAADAYKTAGVSANRYMEISTSFAASLISSLGGDTAAAADMANMAIQDMSDNANKMGTSLEVVQEAYQSLARGNYEMLDSLKLGYGGTKAELERLLSDAEQIAASQGMVRDYSVDSYADIVEAIHLVQDEMGITGTTAQEAASTIEGSVNMMKAAWENWLTGLGNEGADMSVLTDQLVNSVITAGQNIIPRVGQIMTTLGSTLASYAPQVAQQLYDGLMASLPSSVSGPLQEAFNGASDIASQVSEYLAPGLESMAETGGKVAGALAEAFSPAIQEAIGLIAPAAEQLGIFLSNMGNQIQEVLVPAIQPLGEAFAGLFAAIEPWLEPLRNVAELFGNILVAAIAMFMGVLTSVIEIVTGVLNGIMAFSNFVNTLPVTIGNVVNGIIMWFSQLPGMIGGFLSMVITTVAGWVLSMVSNAVQAGSQFLSSVVSFLSQLPGRVLSFLTSVISSVVGWVGSMASNAASAGSRFLSGVVNFISQVPGRIASFLGNVISNVAGFVSDMASGAAEAASDFASSLIDGLSSIPGEVVSIGSDIIGGLVDGVVEAAGRLIDAVGGAVNDALGWAKSLLGIASPSKVFREIGQFSMQGMALGIDDDADLPVRSMDSAIRGIESSAVEYSPQVRARGTGGASVDDLLSAVESLHSDLAAIIRDNTPVMTRREFRRAVLSV